MKKQPKDAVLFVRLTSALHKRVAKEAASADISAASLARGIIRQHFERADWHKATQSAPRTTGGKP